jgi:hypothetical protein
MGSFGGDRSKAWAALRRASFEASSTHERATVFDDDDDDVDGDGEDDEVDGDAA